NTSASEVAISPQAGGTPKARPSDILSSKNLTSVSNTRPNHCEKTGGGGVSQRLNLKKALTISTVRPHADLESTSTKRSCIQRMCSQDSSSQQLEKCSTISFLRSLGSMLRASLGTECPSQQQKSLRFSPTSRTRPMLLAGSSRWGLR